MSDRLKGLGRSSSPEDKSEGQQKTHEPSFVEYVEVSDDKQKKRSGRRNRKSKTSGDISVGTDSETISSTSITIASDDQNGKIEAMLDGNSWDDDGLDTKKGLTEISETDDETSSDAWDTGDLEIGDSRSTLYEKNTLPFPVDRRDSELPSHEDPFAPRPGRTLKWRNVSMKLVRIT